MTPSQRLKAIATVLAACAVAAAAATGCSSSSPSSNASTSNSPTSGSSVANASSTAPVTISVNCEPPTSTPQPRANWLADVAAFEKLYPSITIKSDDANPCDNPTTFNAELASGKMDNVFYTYFTDAGNVISSGQSADIQPYASQINNYSSIQSSLLDVYRKGGAASGDLYGIPTGNYSLGLVYNKTLFKEAGIALPWEPKSWADVLAAAEKIKAKLPGVTPINVYSGKGAGEGATMQGLEMLLYGTGNQLYNASSKQWTPSTPGMLASLNFIKQIYSTGLAPDVEDALNPNFGTTVATELLPEGKLAIDLDGSWMPGTWTSTGSKPWPAWETTMAEAPMPTENGQAPGSTSMSGGWTLAVGSHRSEEHTSELQSPC